mgnify:CR=1 FL=1
MKLYFISLCFAFVACITAKAQSKLIFKDKLINSMVRPTGLEPARHKP